MLRLHAKNDKCIVNIFPRLAFSSPFSLVLQAPTKPLANISIIHTMTTKYQQQQLTSTFMLYTLAISTETITSAHLFIVFPCSFTILYKALSLLSRNIFLFPHLKNGTPFNYSLAQARSLFPLHGSIHLYI